MKLKLMIAALAASVAGTAGAVPVQWTTGAGANGHYYEYIGNSSTWTNARTAALGSTYLGLTGYLATVTSAEENRFLVGLANDGWLGGSDDAVEGDWRWVDGPEAGQLFWRGLSGGQAFGYASWNGGEPNNSGDEDYLQLQGGAWNDLPNGSNRGYFVEYSAAVVPGAVPEPATWAMMIAGFGLMGAALRRRAARVALA